MRGHTKIPPVLDASRRPGELTEQFFALLEQQFERLAKGAGTPLDHTQDYALLLHVHPNYLTNTVTDVTGQSPCAWINARYLFEAKRLLESSQLSIAAICDHLGFADASNFAKYFRKHIGISPSAYRKLAMDTPGNL